MTIKTTQIEASIKVQFATVLRADGFTGSGRTFRRVRNGQIQVINVQGSRYGGEFAVNLAIQPIGIPDVLGNIPDVKTISVSKCELRRRLSESGEDQWWRYDDQASLEHAVDDARKVYEAHGRVLFQAMSTSPSPLDTITVEQLADGPVRLYGFATTKVRLTLLLARLRETEGRISDAVSFAVYGLEQAIGAFGLRPELERIAALPRTSLDPVR